ncbi:MAG: prepilin-type N-terminal cleavage/methylation domain-containing protein [Nitrosomonadales bacterium]|nr:prepilin-type N-terminal cleavage/methylation domain-containing protein [Nitrosomonadales bacterium]
MPAMKHRGYTLIELAVVLFIVALLLGGLLPKLSGKIEQQRTDEARKQLDETREALIGYAIANGRLPCPASPVSNGAESFNPGGSAGDGNCSNLYDGFVPAATLELVTADGYAIDPWGNRLRYAVTNSNNNAYTRTGGMSSTGMSALAPSLLVCATATGISTTSCASNTALTASPGVPVVIYSTGKNGGYGGTDADEAVNLDGNKTFVSHIQTAATSGSGEFDDLVIWLSPGVLYYRMVEAGKLP